MAIKFKRKKVNTDAFNSIAFDLVDESTVERLERLGDIKLPKKKVKIPRDERWNTKQMNSKLLQAIQNGDSVLELQNSLKRIIGNNSASLQRNARTMFTGAECGGRMDSYRELDSQGVVQKKVWVATPDDRTRPSHIDIDGEEQNIEDVFSNGCMYPGDGNGPSDEVWNCRCTMRDHIVGFRRADGTISRVNYQRDETMHDRQMREERERRRESGE
jgi:uncharacterized protein with gpF-like domain